MEKSSFFNAELINGEYDRVYGAEDYARYFSSFIGNGVFPNPSDNLKVKADGKDMKIIVKAGKAWINGYYYENDDDLIIKLASADGVLNRIDRVVVRFDLIEREISVNVKQGKFSSDPVATELERNTDIYELALADIKIQNGAIAINNSNITDLRLNSELCGIVHGTIEQVDTTEIFNTYKYYLDEKMNSNEFNDWFISLKNKLDPNEDIAMQLQVQIAELEENMKKAVNSDMVDGKHAKGELLTNEKEDLVGAINEVFTNASNGKEEIASAITGVGVSADSSMTFSQLAKVISSLGTMKYATGVTSNQNVSGSTEEIFNVGFNPRLVICHRLSQDSAQEPKLCIHFNGFINSDINIVLLDFTFSRIGVSKTVAQTRTNTAYCYACAIGENQIAVKRTGSGYIENLRWYAFQ